MVNKRLIIATVIAVSIVLAMGTALSAGAEDQSKLTILYNNVPFDKRLTTSWGFSCFVRHKEKGILFDTGGNGSILLSNMQKLGIDPKQVDLIVLSHIHGDHTGGLGSLLRKNAAVAVYLPSSFPQAFKHEITKQSAKVVSVAEPTEIYEGAYSSGEMGTQIREQCLILKTKEGLVIITGCAHPGIVGMVSYAKEWLKDDIFLAVGGFHLMGYDEREMKGIINELRQMGVRKIAPSHCTGDTAMKVFKKAWGDDFVDGGCGAVVSIP